MAEIEPFEDQSACQAAAERLRDELARNWKVGDRLPPIKALARRMGVGQTNMHRAAKLLADEGLLVAKSQRGTFVRRLPECEVAGSKATHRALLLRLPVNVRDSFLEPSVDILIERLAQQAVAVQVEEVDIRSSMKDPSIVENFDAVIMLQPASNVLLVNDPSRPMLVMTTSEEEPMAVAAGYDMVTVDPILGGMLAGEWMRRVDPEQLLFLGVGTNIEMTTFSRISARRLEGFEKGFGQPVSKKHIWLLGNYRRVEGEKAFERYRRLSKKPDAIFCASDDLAVGFVQAGLRHGVVPGRDYQIVGFDGQKDGRTLPTGPLTTVRVPVDQLGLQAADLLVSRLANPQLAVRRVLLGCQLTEGTTARPKAAGKTGDRS